MVTLGVSRPEVTGSPGSVQRRGEIPGRLPAAIAAVLIGVAAYPVLERGYLTGAEAAFLVVVCWLFTIVGLLEWGQQPANPVGPLLWLFAISGLISLFVTTSSPTAFTLGYALSALPPLLLAHLLLCYPGGKLADFVDRVAVRAAYFLVAPLPLLLLLVYDPAQHVHGINDCRHGSETGCPESVIVLAADARVYEGLAATQLVVYSVAAIGLTGLVARRVLRAPARHRWLFAVLLAVAVVVAGRVIAGNVLIAQNRAHDVDRVLFWTAGIAQASVAVVVLVGLLRRRLAHAAMSDLVVKLEQMPPEELQDALRRAVGDPSLRLAFWLPERQAFVDGNGAAVDLPDTAAKRGITRLERDGTLLGVLVHDPALEDEPSLATAGAATRLALENAHLHAEIRAQLADVRQSRARIVHAADEERARLERDIHDGAQQRLVALAVRLRLAERKLDGSRTHEVEQLLGSAVDELQRAVTELREFARGVYPAILTEEGLPAALDSLVGSSPIPVRLGEMPARRLPGKVEITAYFVISEALANAVKHSGASEVRIDVRVDAPGVVARVQDNGCGGASVASGTGLSGLVDRVAAVGGTLQVVSPRQHGTTVIARLPCAQ
jgi:signal transduction histidine kinase